MASFTGNLYIIHDLKHISAVSVPHGGHMDLISITSSRIRFRLKVFIMSHWRHSLMKDILHTTDGTSPQICPRTFFFPQLSNDNVDFVCVYVQI